MKQITRDFWYGNIIPQNDCRPNTEETKKLSDLMNKCRNELILTLDKEQISMLNKIDDYLVEYTNITEEAIFSYAFKLGVKMAIETYVNN